MQKTQQKYIFQKQSIETVPTASFLGVLKYLFSVTENSKSFAKEAITNFESAKSDPDWREIFQRGLKIRVWVIIMA